MCCEKILLLLSDYIDEVLDCASHKHVEEHLVSCGSCKVEHAKLKQTLTLLQQLPKLKAPEHIRVDAMKKIQTIPQAKENPSYFQMLSMAAGLLLSLLLGITVVQSRGGYYKQVQESSPTSVGQSSNDNLEKHNQKLEEDFTSDAKEQEEISIVEETHYSENNKDITSKNQSFGREDSNTDEENRQNLESIASSDDIILDDNTVSESKSLFGQQAEKKDEYDYYTNNEDWSGSGDFYSDDDESAEFEDPIAKDVGGGNHMDTTLDKQNKVVVVENPESKQEEGTNSPFFSEKFRDKVAKETKPQRSMEEEKKKKEEPGEISSSNKDKHTAPRIRMQILCQSCHKNMKKDFHQGNKKLALDNVDAKNILSKMVEPDTKLCFECHLPANSHDLLESDCLNCHTGSHSKTMESHPEIVDFTYPENIVTTCLRCHHYKNEDLIDAGHPTLHLDITDALTSKIKHYPDYSKAKVQQINEVYDLLSLANAIRSFVEIKKQGRYSIYAFQNLNIAYLRLKQLQKGAGNSKIDNIIERFQSLPKSIDNKEQLLELALFIEETIQEK